jgi:glycosyltransferase involved in cell wall biosynthesis
VKILWASNAPFVGSGYGVQTSLFGPRVAALGHDLAFYATFGVDGGCLTWQGFNIYPTDRAWGNKTMAACAAHHGDGLDDVLVVTLSDAWVLDPASWPKDMRVAMWAPVDHNPLPGIIRQRLAHETVTPIAMSRFGERMMRDAGLDPLYVPHGIDTQMFRPQPEERDRLRREMNVPVDAFLVGMVAANNGKPTFSRKAFPQVFQAFAKFRETHRDAVLYVHTNEHAANNENGGLHLRPLARACGIPPASIRFTDPLSWELGVQRSDVAGLMAAMDVLVNTSFGEGFGVPIVEAQACGVPVIVTDHSSMTELCGAGWLVDGDPWYDAPQDAWFKCPSVDGIVDALGEAYASWGTMVEPARRFALQYDVETVMDDHWQPALETLAVGRRREVPPLVLA